MQTESATGHLSAFTAKMQKEDLPGIVIETFAHYYRQVVAGATGYIADRDIAPLTAGDVKTAEALDGYAAGGRRRRPKAAMIKLNGGLGTSMGLTGPKSLLVAKNGRTFLDIILGQAEKSGLRLLFMNSFSTHQDTAEAVAASRPATTPDFFLQHKFPKILKKNLAPARWPDNPELEWNPPGHGDIFTALHTSGMLQQLVTEGIVYAFISNADNLGATYDDALLGYFSEAGLPFMMEVAQRTPADRKGGHLARRRIDGRLLLREIAQCPAEEIDAFQDIRHYNYFNTNSLWVNLEHLARLIHEQRIIRLPLILNPKPLDPRNPESPEVYQVETAMGAGISLFEGASAVRVPLQRFFPVKKCNELLAVRSDRFILTDDHCLTVSPECGTPSLKIDLDPGYFGKVDMFENRFPHGAPSLVACSSLTVIGDVFFDKGISIRGGVSITNTRPEPVTLPAGSVIDTDLSF